MSTFFSDLDFPKEEPVKPTRSSSFFSDLDESTPEEKPSRLRSLLGAPVKGAIKGISEAGKMFPLIAKPIPHDLGIDLTEEFLPTHNELPERVLERAGKIAPFAAGGGGIASTALRTLIGAASGQTAKELGGGEVSQILAEMIGMSFPSFSKTLVATKSQKPIVEFARKMGMSEKDIVPHIQGQKKIATLGRLADKKALSESLGKSREATSKIYKKLSESPLAKSPLSEEVTTDLMHGLKDSLSEMPVGVRKVVMKDILETFKGETVDPEKLMNLYHDINYYVGKGASRLNSLKNPIIEAMEKTSPELAEDFRMTNELWKRRAEFGKKIRPGLVDDLKKLGRYGSIVSSFFTGNYKPLLFALGEGISAPIAHKFVTSPRLQNISKQILESLNNSKFAQAKKLQELFEVEIDKKLAKVEASEE